jgi:hypothetical protein
MQSAQDIDGSPQQNGSYRIRITPEVTAFSDNIVVSYPSLGDEPSVPSEVPPHLRIEAHWAKFMCQDAIRILSGVAEMGLRIGVLIRGGFSFGQLYHDNGVVVFAPAPCSVRTMGSRAAAKASAPEIWAARPIEPAAARFLGLPRIAP